MELRDHQILAIEQLRRSIATGHKRPILFAPCSFGKTICAAHISKCAAEKGNKTLFLVHRRLLANQTKEKFDAYGLHSSIIMAGYETDFTAPVMITTHQTYSRRIELCSPEANKFFHDAACLIVDEAHFGISPSYKKIYGYYDGKIIIGLTGSPARGDQRGLGEVFDDLVESIGVKELTDQSYLTPARYFAPTNIDLSDVKITAGDYNKKQLQEKMNTASLNGDIMDNWLRIAEGRQTIIFTTGVRHSKALKKQFANNGIPTEHLDAHSSDEERERVLRQFRDGDIRVVTNCQLFTEGYDADFVSCIVLARGTKSYPLFVQMVGRGQRIYPGKEDFMVIDHGSNISRFGFLTDPVEWTLDGKKIAWKKPRKKEKELKTITCEMCTEVFKAQSKCPTCGHPVKYYGKKVETTECELEEVSKGKHKKKLSHKEKTKWYSMLDYERRRLGKSEKWLLANYRQRCGCWPRMMDSVAPMEPDMEVSNWLKYQRIKWIKGQQKNANRR